MLAALLSGGVTITPDRAVGAWASYNASYGLANVVPTPSALQAILPGCIETLRGNPYSLAPAQLRTARDHAGMSCHTTHSLTRQPPPHNSSSMYLANVAAQHQSVTEVHTLSDLLPLAKGD
jgi:hypothetical protein